MVQLINGNAGEKKFEREGIAESVREPRNRWWRRRELNPRPRAVVPGYYMLSSPFRSRPHSARRAGNECGPASVVFDVSAETVRQRLAHIDDIRTRRREQPSGGR